MVVARRLGVLALFLFSAPLAVHADVSSLVWGGAPDGPEQIAMIEGGTYSVPLETLAPTFVTGPPIDPNGEFVFGLFGKLYAIDGSGTRDYVETFNRQAFDDPEDPEDGDPLFAWPSAGSYELDLFSFPPPQVNFEDRLRRWIAWILFADIAHAQFGEPIFLGTIHFTIEDAANSEPDPVIIIPGILGSEQHNGEWVIDPILHTYDDLIATLDANGYTPGVDLFPFPYNWRKSNVETALLLKEKIDEVKGICACNKVDLVAHSMGGLVARQYIQSDAYEQDVDQLIFLGTPHLGAPKAYLMWEGGEVAPPPYSIQDKVLQMMLEHEGYEKRYPTLFAYLRTEPIEAVRELLSVEGYLFDGSNQRQYPTNYPANNFLESLNANVDSLLNTGTQIYNFVGETGNQETIKEIRVVEASQFAPMWLDGYPEGFYENSGNPGIIEGQGDKTVPLTSASFITSNLVVTSYEHGALPTQMEGDIYEILTRKIPGTLIQRFINIPNVRLIFIKIFSPADLLVIAPDGKKIGKDFNGQEVNGIPNAFYTGFTTDTEFITILNPLDGEYKIYTQGTESGQYTVEASFVSEATTTEASFTGNTAPGITSQLNLPVEEGSIEQDSLEPVVTYESTLADLDRVYALGWVNVGIYKSMKTQLKAAKKGPPVVAKRLLHAMLKQLKQYRGRLMQEQGYQLLKADLEQLINL